MKPIYKHLCFWTLVVLGVVLIFYEVFYIGRATATYDGLTAFQWSQFQHEEGNEIYQLIQQRNMIEDTLAGCEHGVYCPKASPYHIILGLPHPAATSYCYNGIVTTTPPTFCEPGQCYSNCYDANMTNPAATSTDLQMTNIHCQTNPPGGECHFPGATPAATSTLEQDWAKNLQGTSCRNAAVSNGPEPPCPTSTSSTMHIVHCFTVSPDAADPLTDDCIYFSTN